MLIMTVLNLLASAQGQKGDEANISLAKEIYRLYNKVAIKELIDNLNNKDKNLQSDCIKTLYEIGFLKPELIADYYADFLKLLTSKNNRLVWGGMIALSTITDMKHAKVFASLDRIIETVNNGSVITIDCGVLILARLNKHAEYFDTTDSLLIEQLWKCPVKQLPMYIEKSLVSINKKNKEIYINLINKRFSECDKDSQRKRLERSLKQISKIK
jgi:hypothetical protein